MEEEEESSGSGDMWLVSYADLMTLLFAAFVVLYGLKSEGETREIRGVVSSIREAFIEIPDQIIDPDRGPSHEGRFVFKNMKSNPIKENFIKRFKRNDHFTNKIDKDFRTLKTSMDEVNKRSKNRLASKINDNISVRKVGKNITVTIPASIVYDPNSYRIRREAFPSLGVLAKFIEKLDRDIIIQAYANSSPTASTKMPPIELASLRSTYLVRFFTRKFPVPRRRLFPNGLVISDKIRNMTSQKLQSLGDRVDVKIIYEK